MASDDSKDITKESKIEGTINAVTGLFEKVPVYDDAIQPLAKQTGRALETVGQAVNAALAPLRGLIWGIEQIEEFVQAKVAEKLRDVPPENIQTPDPSVAGPTLESLRFVGHKESLSDLYANLLATSMDAQTARQAHPGFVEIIRNLSSDEAKLLSFVLKEGSQPLVDVRKEKRSGAEGSVVSSYICTLAFDAQCAHRDLIGSYIRNLERLGLIDVVRGAHLTAEGIYDRILDDPPVKKLLENLDAMEEHKSRVMKYFLRPSALGLLFGAACVSPHDQT